MPLTVLIAPSGFKESLPADAVAEAMAEGVRRARPDARVLKAPMIDGGEGFTASLIAATAGTLHRCRVEGPAGEAVDGYFGMLGGADAGTAAVEVAAAAGLALIARDRRDPRRTTSYGVGQFIRAALDRGARRIIVGCGDSGINDAGAGMMQALGARLLDAGGSEIGRGGAELGKLARIDLGGLDVRLGQVEVVAAVNWHNVLLGERGVTRVYGPQKGATAAQVEELEAALANFARRVAETTGIDVRSAPGTGASGGLGASLLGLAGGRLCNRYDLLMSYTGFDGLLPLADLVLTAEGMLDAQTVMGKVPAEVGRRAKVYGIPVIALAGSVGAGAETVLEHGIDAYMSIASGPLGREEALSRTEGLLIDAAAAAVRMAGAGLRAGEKRARPKLATLV